MDTVEYDSKVNCLLDLLGNTVNFLLGKFLMVIIYWLIIMGNTLNYRPSLILSSALVLMSTSMLGTFISVTKLAKLLLFFFQCSKGVTPDFMDCPRFTNLLSLFVLLFHLSTLPLIIYQNFYLVFYDGLPHVHRRLTNQ